MDVSHLLDGLNEPQRKAVAAVEGPLLVLAGAGSGKTRVLTHRVAWLVQAYSYSPLSILAVTFTNKAASEMRGRIEQMLGFPVGGMWMGTFHGLSHRLLRTHWQEAGLPQNFQIIDSDDQLRVVKRVIANMELDDSYWQPKQGQHFINYHKEAGRRAGDVHSGPDPQQQQWAKVYREYEVHCQRSGLVDFAELLLRTWEMMHNNEVLRLQYRERFRAVLVDEFQDTNSIQYRWLKEFVGPQSHIMVVGDDDQSIYSWRGAQVENIRKFEKDFRGTEMVRLEQNYRSTSTILNAANAVIANNASRLGKNLWTEDGEGEPIRLYNAYNEVDEARFVVERIRHYIEDGHRRDESAILYRTTAQSRLFEEALIQAWADGLVPGEYHTGVGEEGINAGIVLHPAVELLVPLPKAAHVDVEVVDYSIGLLIEQVRELQGVHAADPGTVFVVVFVARTHTVYDPNGFGLLSVGALDLAARGTRGIDQAFELQAVEHVVQVAVSVGGDAAGVELLVSCGQDDRTHFQVQDLLLDHFRLFILDFLIFDLLVLGNTQIVIILFNLVNWHKEAFCFPILVFFILPIPEFLKYVGNIPFPVNERPLVIQAVPVCGHIIEPHFFGRLAFGKEEHSSRHPCIGLEHT